MLKPDTADTLVAEHTIVAEGLIRCDIAVYTLPTQ
jgi:hypothetical protein